MANTVTKRDGTKVPFDPEKIRHGSARAANEAGVAEQEANDIASEVSQSVIDSFEGQEEVSSDEVGDKILFELDEKHPSVAEAWRKYEESKGE